MFLFYCISLTLLRADNVTSRNNDMNFPRKKFYHKTKQLCDNNLIHFLRKVLTEKRKFSTIKNTTLYNKLQIVL